MSDELYGVGPLMSVSELGQGLLNIKRAKQSEQVMNRDEATALFERVYQQLSSTVHPFTASLIYTQSPSMLGKRDWHISIESWRTHWKITSERDWQEYKYANAVIETDEDLEEYADAARTEAESE